eukprot:scaffold4868_cov416-Prasinococcus_capsulatus_cf.AAC.39
MGTRRRTGQRRVRRSVVLPSPPLYVVLLVLSHYSCCIAARIRGEDFIVLEQTWRRLFLAYKWSRLKTRRSLWAAITEEDFDRAAQLQREWNEVVFTAAACQLGSFVNHADCCMSSFFSGHGATSDDALEGITFEQQARLAAGRFIVPGVCFRHAKYAYRGVVIGCDHSCNTTQQWKKLMNVSKLPRGSLQPFYHCLVHMEDRPGGQMTFVAEENIGAPLPAIGGFAHIHGAQSSYATCGVLAEVVEDDSVYPIAHPLVEPLLVRCDELHGYLALPRLEDTLKRQIAGESFQLPYYMCTLSIPLQAKAWCPYREAPRDFYATGRREMVKDQCGVHFTHSVHESS